MFLCSSQNTWWSLQAAPAKQVSSEDEDEQFCQAADSQEQEHSGYGWLGLSRRRRTSCMLAPLQPSNDPHAAARAQRQRRREASKPERQRAEALQAMIQQMSLHFQEVRLGLCYGLGITPGIAVSHRLTTTVWLLLYWLSMPTCILAVAAAGVLKRQAQSSWLYACFP